MLLNHACPGYRLISQALYFYGIEKVLVNTAKYRNVPVITKYYLLQDYIHKISYMCFLIAYW
jgi:hypothetical protein